MLTANIPHKKMKMIGKFRFIAQCDCGFKHKFKSKDIDMKKSNGSIAIFHTIYKCPKCGQTYDGIFEEIANRNVWYKQLNFTGTLIMLILAFGLVFGGYEFYTKVWNSSPPTDYEHMTNKQLNDFLKWDHEQQQQKYDNQPAFDNK